MWLVVGVCSHSHEIDTCHGTLFTLQVTLYWYFNYTIVPRTEIPIDQSNCSTVAPTSYPCTAPPPPPTSTCDGLLIATQSSGGLCFTNSQTRCNSMACDLSSFLFPISYNITVLPCLDVPGIELLVASNGTIVLDEVLTHSRTETVSVGPANVSLNIVVLQSSDLSSIEVGVSNLIKDVFIRLGGDSETIEMLFKIVEHFYHNSSIITNRKLKWCVDTMDVYTRQRIIK